MPGAGLVSALLLKQDGNSGAGTNSGRFKIIEHDKEVDMDDEVQDEGAALTAVTASTLAQSRALTRITTRILHGAHKRAGSSWRAAGLCPGRPPPTSQHRFGGAG